MFGRGLDGVAAVQGLEVLEPRSAGAVGRMWRAEPSPQPRYDGLGYRSIAEKQKSGILFRLLTAPSFVSDKKGRFFSSFILH